MQSRFFLLISFIACTTGCTNGNSKTALLSSKDSKKDTANSQTSVAVENKPGTDCNQVLWKHVYDPDRLEVLDKCKTVTGVIEESNADPDGDQHMLLKLDKGQKDFLTKKNKSKKDGDLVVEVVCVNNISRKRAMGACTGYANNVMLPKIGEHVRVTGSFVLDTHNGWNEIHPVSKIEEIK